MVKIHPFDMYDKLLTINPKDYLGLVALKDGSVVIDGVNYLEDTAAPYDVGRATTNGLVLNG